MSKATSGSSIDTSVSDDADIIVFVGTDNADVDTPALQAAVDRASALRQPLHWYGTARVKFDTVPWFYMYSDPTRPVYPAIKVTSGNLEIVGFGAVLRFQPPSPLPAGSAPCVAFCTPMFLYDRSITNISITGVTFDFIDDIGRLPGWTQALYISCCWNILLENITCTATPRVQAVTMTNDDMNRCIISWPNHGFLNGQAACWLTGGDLPPELTAGFDYFIRGVTADSFGLGLLDVGPLVMITPGTYSAIARGVNFNTRGPWIDNSVNVVELNNQYEYGKQGGFYNLLKDHTVIGCSYHAVTEGLDVDTGVNGFIYDDLTFTRGWGEAQPFDLSPASNGVISNIVCDEQESIVYLYTKGESGAPWSFQRKYRYFWAIGYTIGSPGVLQITGAELTEGLIFWMEIRPDDIGSTMPGGTAEFTNYLVRNPVGDTCNFSLQSDGPSGALVNITSDAVLAPGAFIRCRIIPVEPALASENVIVDGVVSRRNQYNADTRIFDIGTNRQLKVGINRGQYYNGSPVSVKNLTMRNITIEGGSIVRVYEGDGVFFENWRLVGLNPGEVGTDDAAIWMAQSLNDPDAVEQSLLNAELRNIEIVNTRGIGVTAQAPANLLLDNIVIDGWNLQELDDTSQAIRLTHPEVKPGVYTFGKIETKNGTDGPTSPERSFQLVRFGGETEAKKIYYNGPFTFWDGTNPLSNINTDTGPLVQNRRTFQLGQQTTASGTVTVPFFVNNATSQRLLYASVVNFNAITGDAVNFTTLQLRKSVAGSSTNLGSAVAIDSAAKSACSVTNLSIDGTVNNMYLAPGSVLYLQYTPTLAGSIIGPLTIELVLPEFGT